MVCVCVEGYQGNAAVQCDKGKFSTFSNIDESNNTNCSNGCSVVPCPENKGFVRDIDGNCVCPPGSGIDVYGDCIPCRVEDGFKIDENGRCVCALERGFIIDERGRCTCPTEYGYRITPDGRCTLTPITERPPGCTTDDDCADYEFCQARTRTCVVACEEKPCGINAFCNGTNHVAICQCITGYQGNPEIQCSKFHTMFRFRFQIGFHRNLLLICAFFSLSTTTA